MVCLFFVTEAEVVTEMCSPAAASFLSGLKRFTFSQPDKLAPFNRLLFPSLFLSDLILIMKKGGDLLRFQSCR